MDTRKDLMQELSTTKEVEDDEEFSRKPETLIKRLVHLEHKNYINPTEMKEHLETMLLAGGDTLGTTMSSTLLLIAMHPDVQEKIFEELQQVLNSKDDVIDLTVLAKLPYLEMVCKESQRMIPTVPVITRRCGKDFELCKNLKMNIQY